MFYPGIHTLRSNGIKEINVLIPAAFLNSRRLEAIGIRPKINASKLSIELNLFNFFHPFSRF